MSETSLEYSINLKKATKVMQNELQILKERHDCFAKSAYDIQYFFCNTEEFQRKEYTYIKI